MRLPEQPQSPAPPPIPSAPPKESLLKGLAIAWAMTVGGETLAIQMVNTFNAFWLPPVLTAIIALALLFTGKRRIGIGMLLGLLAMAALILLLVAACFGLVSAFK
jgi:hypothetical protein